MGIKYYVGHVKTGQEFLRPFTLFEWWMLYFNWFLQGNALWTVSPYRANLPSLLSEPLFLVGQVFFCAIFLRGLWSYRLQENRTRTQELFLLIFSLPSVMFVLTHIGYQHLYIERYLLLVLPFFLIVLARGAASFANAKAVIACSLAAVVIGVASYGALLYKSDRWTVYKQNPDWRSAARYFSAHFEFILTDTDVQAFYLLKNNYWVAGADKVLQRFKDDKRLELSNSQAFKGLEIYTFVRQGTAVD
ncbi:MAG: hypothetical protein HY268_00520 [Deltaproteobacteria bacterium]|nr:hypothetical protein [Deltaproteobacteria bacterium]